jgi:hypothetical protein
MNELNRLAEQLEAEELTNEDIENIIMMVRQRLAGYDAGARAKTSEAESVNLMDIVQIPKVEIKLKRRI